MRCRGVEDSAGELGAGHPWKRWLMLVLAADLEEVEEVRRGGVDAYDVLTVRRIGIWEVDDAKVGGSLQLVLIGQDDR